MKNIVAPMEKALPSPTFLWRFKMVLFLMWGLTCCKVGWDSVMRMDANLRDLFLYEAFLYYNPLLLVTMMVWLWGVNLWVFLQSSINYPKIFEIDQNHLTHREIWKCSTWMTILVPTSMTAYLYLYSHGEVSLAASQPVLLYILFAVIMIFPFDIFYLSSRYFFLRTLWRIAFPLQPISFPDFFVADILTSMSKVFSDLERSVCRMVNKQVATIAWLEADSVCGSHSVAIPMALVLPYLWRLLQCLRQYKDTKDKTCLFNALKYSTAFPVIFLSALKYHVFPEKWTTIYRPLWLFSSLINSLYSFYWDITRDWDLSGFSRIFKFNRPSAVSNALHGRQWVRKADSSYYKENSSNMFSLALHKYHHLALAYVQEASLFERYNTRFYFTNPTSELQIYFWMIGSNFILRGSWTYKLSAHLRHNYLTVFAITLLEMFRRFQWIFFRVEKEVNKTTRSGGIQLVESEKEDEKLLGTTNIHDV